MKCVQFGLVFGALMSGVICDDWSELLNGFYLKSSENLSRGINEFSYDLFKILARENKFDETDLVFSPLSTHVLLSLSHRVVGKDNIQKMKEALHLPENEASTIAAYTFLVHNMKKFENVTMNMANKISVSNKHQITLLDQIAANKTFNIRLSEFDFEKPYDAAVAINKWVDDSTNHLIKNMMADYYMEGCTGMTLLSTGYFEGDWKYPFNKYLTKDRDFHVNEEETKKVPMMFLEKALIYGELPGQKARFVKLPYKNENVEMLIILPDEINGLENILANLQQYDKKTIGEAARKTYVQLHLPKFRVASDTFILDGYLKELGMADIFKKSYDPFAVNPNGTEWFVDSVLQKPFIKINEAGTTTKSEPVGWFVSSSNNVADAPKVTFDVNRPFYYQISYNDTIMFQGATSFKPKRAVPLIKKKLLRLPFNVFDE